MISVRALPATDTTEAVGTIDCRPAPPGAVMRPLIALPIVAPFCMAALYGRAVRALSDQKRRVPARAVALNVAALVEVPTRASHYESFATSGMGIYITSCTSPSRPLHHKMHLSL